MIAVIDAGTTNVKLVVYDEGKVVDFRKEPIVKRSPHPGWLEIDVEDLAAKCKRFADYAIERYGVEAIGITNQRTTAVLWDARSGKAVMPALGWQDTRALDVAARLNRDAKLKIGRVLGKIVENAAKIIPTLSRRQRAKWLITVANFSFSPNHTSVKLRWMLDHVDAKRELMAGTIDSWIVFKLTGEHLTDYSNAAATGLYDSFFMRWSRTAMEIAGIDESLLPKVVESDEIFGEYRNVPITGVIADQSASLYALGCWEEGQLKVTNGTGSFVDLNVGSDSRAYPKLMPLIAWKLKGETKFMLEGMLYYSGSAVELMRDLGLFDDVKKTSDMAFSSQNDELLLVPSFTGLATPHYVTILGMIYGISNALRKEDFAKALLEAIAFRIAEIIELMKDVGEIETVRCDGEMSSNDFLLQRIADATGLRVERSSILAASAYGSYLVAGRALGLWKRGNPAEVSEVFEPKNDVAAKFERWRKLVEIAKGVDAKMRSEK